MVFNKHASSSSPSSSSTPRASRAMSLPGWMPTMKFSSDLQEDDTLNKPVPPYEPSIDDDDDLDEVCSNGSSDTTVLSSYNSSPRTTSTSVDSLKSPPPPPLLDPHLSLPSPLPSCHCPMASDSTQGSFMPQSSRMSAAIPSSKCTCAPSNEDVDPVILARLADDFRAQRLTNQANALMWSVEQATARGVVSNSTEQTLYHLIGRGAFEEARDILYRHCHLTPAVHNLGSKATAPDNTPLSPTVPVDVVANSALTAFVDAMAPKDSVAGRRHKQTVLRALSTLVASWVKRVGVERGLSPEHIALTSGALFAAGSYRLAIDDPSSDIDTVAVAPWHVTHADFFGSFVDLLRSCPAVSSLTPVSNAFVPLLALVYDNVALDVLFARVPMPTVLPSQDIDSDYILAGVDPASIKSLNAPRVSTLLLRLVPQPAVFRAVARAIRAWAKARGIYSSKWGYLGGVSWTILVAFVCQMYPQETDCESVFVRFFHVMSEWAWPQPVMLNVLYDAGLGLESWDPRLNVFDRTHLMPIITPAYPPMNSAVQVSHTTFKVMYDELWRARHFADLAAHAANDADVKRAKWVDLFAPTNFFVRYDVYLGLSYSANTRDDMCIWSKFVHSRVRKLVDGLQHVEGMCNVHALPTHFPHPVGNSSPDGGEGGSDGQCLHRESVFIGLEFKARVPSNRSIFLDPQMEATIGQTIRFFEATDLQQFGVRAPGMTLSTTLLQWESLPEFVFAQGREAARDDRVRLATAPASHPAPPPPPRSRFVYPAPFGTTTATMNSHHRPKSKTTKKAKRKDKQHTSSI
ncbi:hypothetical protein DYB25_000252 [Aphanomyces astaci]|uniref:polynucleotide adenylyltransferase n=1 Tax=Aphanomyces astaci TaxID=112090 RepID=A0A397APF8_APHAT|nr:hypothetical protein DYB25_000252 [Aphanomyces astaci]RHY07678.1 hypothetical protein DYB36_000860 [Aphanomyces astaci]RHY61688.1 hypothetical protein DYB30_000489 [Aphanomyces astaci]RHY74361.1 hypothetical protein DYB34_000095 [Aphanomyces astaci]RHY83623.1 hypothetical protein DYB26_000088 [Aphanomyces astaci]